MARDRRPSKDAGGQSLTMTIARNVTTLVAAYLIAVALYLIIDSTSIAVGTHFGWDPSLRSGLFFLMLATSTVALCMPLLQTDPDASLRTFSALTAAVLVGYAVLRGLGYVNTDAPMRFIEHGVLSPLRHLLNL